MAEEYEKRTPVFDFEAGEFVTDLQGRIVTVTEEEAVVQIALKALQTVRGVYLIYGNLEDDSRDHTYGNDTENVLRAPGLSDAARIAEIERSIKEALIYDPWITKITDLQVKRRRDLTGKEPYIPAQGDHIKTDEVYASFTVHHIFGTTEIEEAAING